MFWFANLYNNSGMFVFRFKTIIQLSHAPRPMMLNTIKRGPVGLHPILGWLTLRDWIVLTNIRTMLQFRKQSFFVITCWN